ncbi:MAG: oligosaccharide flippase family protein [Acidimicrobiia bacterium]|nr:oligosaccharide flippase family protein [Acidimicrobiia bacterium]
MSTFGRAGLLFVANSLAITLAHWGVGLAVMRLAPEDRLSARMRRQVRLLNLFVLTLLAVGGAIAGGSWGWLGLAVGVLWFVAGEAFIAKAAALNAGWTADLARAEVLGAVTLLAIVTFGPASLLGVALALCMKSAVEVLSIRRVNDRFSEDGSTAWPVDLLISQSLTFSTANVDYLVVWLLIGAGPLGVYTLAYRVGSALQAQIANVASRLSLVDFGRTSGAALGARYLRYVSVLFAVGVVGAVASAAGAPLLPAVLGERWRDVVPVLVVVSIGAPWRFLLGVAGSLAVGTDHGGSLVRWEVVRLLGTAGAVLCGAIAGFPTFVVATSVAAIVGAAALHVVATRRAGLAVPPWMIPAAMVSILLSVALTPAIPTLGR